MHDLEIQAADLREDGVGPTDGRVRTTELSLAASRQELAYAELEAKIAQPPAERQTAPVVAIWDGPIAEAIAPAAAAPALHLNARQLAGVCDSFCEDFGQKWNVWMEGRATAVNDTLTVSNSSGIVGAAGADYKVLPRLTLGMSFSIESFDNRSGNQGARMTMLGFSALPYIGFKIDDNLIASAFVGVSTLAYNTSPVPGTTGGFNGLRFMTGGSIAGTWHDGPWRFSPTLSGSYGNETQTGYTDSAGNVVPGQVVSYGRIEAGPEIGYTFYNVEPGVAVEPFVSLKGAIDFASATISTSSAGVPIVVRPGTNGSGSLGAGVSIRSQKGFSLRVQGSYDSIGVNGLDIWSGVIRGVWSF